MPRDPSPMEQSTRVSCPPDDALEAFAAGGDEPGVSEHLGVCIACRARVQEMRENNRFLVQVRARGISPADPLPSDFIPGYQLLDEIHRGGQGVVYKAVQTHTRRKVAVKLLLPGKKSSDRHRIRFEQEISLAASLRHPNIVTVLDCVSPRDGRLGYSMEYVRGRPLDDWAQGRGFAVVPSLEDKLRLFIKVCEAVQYAHRRGIIHRDLKPGNILVDTEGEPRLCDFGVAKTGIGDAAQTATGEFVGTLAYASPEQVAGVPEGIDTRSDVYGLGVVLYELVTGSMPHDLEGPLPEVARRIQTTEPRRPSLPAGRLNADLETIILKSLAKEPDRRYQSPQRLADDLRRYLAGEMIEARRASGWYVIRKTARRHRMPVAIGASFLAVMAGFGVYSWAMAARLEAALFDANFEQARALAQSGDAVAAEPLLWKDLLTSAAVLDPDAHSGLPTSRAWWALRQLYAAAPCMRTTRFGTGPVNVLMAVPGHPDRALIANAAGDMAILDTADLSAHRMVRATTADPTSPDAAAVFAAAFRSDGTIVSVHADGALRRWNGDSLAPIGVPLPVVPPGVFYASFSPDGSTLGLADINRVRILGTADAEFGREREQFKCSPDYQHRPVFSLGDTRVFYRAEPEAFVLGTFGGKSPPLRIPFPKDHHPNPRAFLPDGSGVYYTLFASAGVLDFATGEWRSVAQAGRVSRAYAFSVSSNQTRLALAGDDHRVSIFNARPGDHENDPTYLVGHAALPTQTLFTDDGRALLSADRAGVVKRWDVSGATTGVRPLLGHQKTVFALALSPPGSADETLVYSGSEDGTVRAWNLERAQERFRSPHLPDMIDAVAISPDGATIAAAVRVNFGRSDIAILDSRLRLRHTIPSAHSGRCAAVAFRHDGKVLASAGDDDYVRLWNAETWQPEGKREVHFPARSPPTGADVRSVAFSPDDRAIAWAGEGGVVSLCDPSLKSPRLLLGRDGAAHTDTMRGVCFTPDGRRLAAAGNEFRIGVWDTRSGRALLDLGGHTGVVYDLDFSADGRLLVSCGADGSVRLWDARRGTSLAVLRDDAEHGFPPCGVEGRHYFTVVFTPDGGRVVVAGNAGYLALWDLRAYDTHITGNRDFWADTLQGDGRRAPDAVREWAHQRRGVTGAK